MSATATAPALGVGLPGWIVSLARAVVALALGVLITLTLDHSAEFALVVFGLFALLSGAILVAAGLAERTEGSRRVLLAIQGVSTTAAGVAALVATEAGVPYLVIVVAAFALVTGALEVIRGLRERGRSSAARDAILVGALTLLVGVVFLLVPADLAEPFSGERGVAGTLTSAVVLTGVLGAWAIVVGVVQAISAVTLRGEARSAESGEATTGRTPAPAGPGSA